MYLRANLKTFSAAFVLGLSSFVTQPVRADILDQIAIGLGSAGFDIRGGHNILSGGTDILVTNTFRGEVFDFGALELTLSGPLSLDFSTGGRLLRNLDVAISTATSSNSNPTPLAYELNYDVGGQQTTVSGTLLIDGALSFNQYGWYELNVDYSSRQTTVNDGRFDTGTSNSDLDIGPINVRGNIFADMLAAVTDPFFEAANVPNLFASFSGRVRLEQLLSEQLGSAVSQLSVEYPATSATGRLRTPFGELFGPVSDALDASAVAARSTREAVLNSFERTDGQQTQVRLVSSTVDSYTSSSVVPEPTVFLLMLLGVPALLVRRRKNRLH